MRPKLTIVLPVRNGAAYLRESIASVLEQSVGEFALHIYDDGSTDETPAIIASFRDARITVVRNDPGRGLFATLNTAFERAETELVRIWAHDDRMLPGSLERFLAVAAAHPDAGMVYCALQPIDAGGTRHGSGDPYPEQRRRTPEVAGPTVSALLFYCYGSLPGNISTVLLRRSVWGAVGGFLPGIQQAPDYDMWVKASAIAPVVFVKEPLIELREHPAQLGNQGQKLMTTIEEEMPVVMALRARLASVVPSNVLDSLWRSHRGMQHVHWIARALARGDRAAARRGLRAMRAYPGTLRQVAMWLLTANGKLGRRSAHRVVDTYLPDCVALDRAGRS